ncbi:holin family protein [Rhodobacteraceae bacterium]|nr:holin family protein [Paracoccaceae bacterium]
MGIIGDIFGTIFGGGRNVIRDTVEVFRPNAEASAVRDAAREAAVLAQFAAEFAQPKQGIFDRSIDGLNRLPRPLLAFGTLGLFVSAMVDPIWFAQRMQGVALVPEPLWWLMGAIVSFYFGARHQAKNHDLQKGLTATIARTADVTRHIRDLEDLRVSETDDVSDAAFDAPMSEDEAREPAQPTERTTGPVDFRGNAALAEWRAGG